MNLYKNIFTQNEINVFKNIIHKENFITDGWTFPSENSNLYFKIMSIIKSKKELKKKLLSNSYLVIRIIDKNSDMNTIEPHFDSHKETFFIPLEVPDEMNLTGEEGGELFIWHNIRNPKYFVQHLLGKILIQNKLSQALILKFFKKKFIKVEARPGDCIFFNGFRSLHYNTPCQRYVSIVIHQNLSFKKNFLSKLIVKYAQKRVTT